MSWKKDEQGQVHMNIKAPKLIGCDRQKRKSVYFFNKIIIYKWQKAICLVKQLHKFIHHDYPFSQNSE